MCHAQGPSWSRRGEAPLIGGASASLEVGDAIASQQASPKSPCSLKMSDALPQRSFAAPSAPCQRTGRRKNMQHYQASLTTIESCDDVAKC